MEHNKIVKIEPLDILSKTLENASNGLPFEDSLVKTFTDFISQDIEDNKHLTEDELFEFLKDKYGDYCDINLGEKL
jgi:hemerythrin-like domain-containing protein